MDTQSASRPGRIQRLWKRVKRAVSWTPPTSTEIGVVGKSALAAGLSWLVADAITGVTVPVLASLTALVVVQVSVRASIATALQRSVAVVLGVLLALGIGDALPLNALTVALLVGVLLAVAELVLRLPRAAARQVPISGLVVLAAVASTHQSQGWHRAVDTVIGAAVGMVVSLVLPASRRVDARQTLERLGDNIGGVLEAMGNGVLQPWSTTQTEEWRRTARTARTRMVVQAQEAIGNGRESARWNVRDRSHVAELGRYEDVLPRLERTAIGASVIARGLDDHTKLSGTTHREMPSMGELLLLLASAVRALVSDVLSGTADSGFAESLDAVRQQREVCIQAASRRARMAIEGGEHDDGPVEGEWLSYAALLVQVDRIVADLNAPLPA